ncbi:hypothetical protein CTI12_AA630320 [Artemisia annua]|uniref:Cyanobacterial aminoacyl-tRNA synthetase CAAD domain-containing protein n=1 Tax=Artemisia annua TaxID=35608 RepID=A0A2U1K913_ARTAN|nr:hypothetical protein CTI12_AA630320 [Artemisia annua]
MFQIKASEGTSPVDANELFDDLKEKWDALENKSTVIVYGGGAVFAIWLFSIFISDVNSVPLGYRYHVWALILFSDVLIASKNLGVGRTWIHRMVCLPISPV